MWASADSLCRGERGDSLGLLVKPATTERHVACNIQYWETKDWILATERNDLNCCIQQRDMLHATFNKRLNAGNREKCCILNCCIQQRDMSHATFCTQHDQHLCRQVVQFSIVACNTQHQDSLAPLVVAVLLLVVC